MRASLLALLCAAAGCSNTHVVLKDQRHLDGRVRRGDAQRGAILLRVDGARDAEWIAITEIESVEPPGLMPVWLGSGLATVGLATVVLSAMALDDSNTDDQVAFAVPGMIGGVFMMVGGATWAGISGGSRSRAIDALDRAGWAP